MPDASRMRAALAVAALLVAMLTARPDSASAQGESAAAREPADLETSVAAMARVGFAASPSFSPDGRRIAFVSNLSGLPQVWTAPVGGGYPRQVTALDDPVQSVAWSSDETGDWLAFTVAPGGGMNAQVYLVKPDGTGLTRVTDGGKETNRLAGWSRDGRLLLLGSNRANPRAIDGYLYDVATGGPMRLVLRNEGVGGLVDMSRDGHRALIQRVKSRGDSNLFLLDIPSGVETLLTPHQGPGTFDGVLAADGGTVYLRSDLDRDLAAFARIRLDRAGKPGPIEVIAARDDAELDSFAMSEDGRQAALVWNEAGRSALSFVDLADGDDEGAVAPAVDAPTGESAPAPAPFGVGIGRSTPRAATGPRVGSAFESSRLSDLPAEIVGGLTFSKDGRRLALVGVRRGEPRATSGCSTAAGCASRASPRARIRASISTPWCAPSWSASRRTTASSSAAGSIARPAAAAPFPWCSRSTAGPRDRSGRLFNATYQALLERGIGVFAPNVRGSSGFGKRFVNLDNGALRHDGVRDLETCARWVVGRRASPIRSGWASWAARTAATW